MNSVLSRFSQVLSQRQAQSGGGALGEGGVGLGAGISSAERSRQERLYNLKASARNLQSKIASASAEISAKPGEFLFTELDCCVWRVLVGGMGVGGGCLVNKNLEQERPLAFLLTELDCCFFGVRPTVSFLPALDR